MRLTRAQRHLLDEGTDAQRKAMEILLTVGRLADAPRLVPTTSAHVSGASYKMIGDPGLEFLEDFAQTARVSVPTTVNRLGTDLAQWQEDRKSTRLNSSHVSTSYAVFCLKKKITHDSA